MQITWSWSVRCHLNGFLCAPRYVQSSQLCNSSLCQKSTSIMEVIQRQAKVIMREAKEMMCKVSWEQLDEDMSNKWHLNALGDCRPEQPTLHWEVVGNGEARTGPRQPSSDARVCELRALLALAPCKQSDYQQLLHMVTRESILTLSALMHRLKQTSKCPTPTLMYQPQRPCTAIYNQGPFSVTGLWETERWFFFSLSSYLFCLLSFLWIKARFIALGEFFKALTVGLILLLLKPLGVLPMLLMRTELGQCCQLWSPRFLCSHVKVGNRVQIKWEPV